MMKEKSLQRVVSSIIIVVNLCFLHKIKENHEKKHLIFLGKVIYLHRNIMTWQRVDESPLFVRVMERV